MGLRHKSIRLRVLLLILVPVLSLIGVYAYAATITVNAAINLQRARTVKNVTAQPAGAVQTQLATERRLALMYMAAPTSRALTQLNLQERITDRVVRLFDGTSMSGTLTADASRPERAAASRLVRITQGLPRLRDRITSGTITRLAAFNAYNAMVTATDRMLEEAVQQYDNVPLVIQSVTLVRLDEADQVVLEESDLVTSDLAARSFPPADRAEFAQLAGLREYLVADSLPQLNPGDRALYEHFVSPQQTRALAHLENAVIHGRAAHGLPPVQPMPWAATVTSYSTGLGKALTQAADSATIRASLQGNSIYLRLILAGGLGLLAIIVSLLFSFFIGRGLIRQLGELRESALELANDRLPSVMQRLRDGQPVDVAAEAPSVEASADEIDQVRQAFHVVQRTAIQAAVDEASLRRGISDVFRNLARRSQVLLHRQLRLLDGMERRASEPGELEDLFRIDHLTTRMRRHAEGLIILSGDSPGRSWRHPVPLQDVLRAAVAEVEDYARIRVEVRTRAALAGSAVADVIHLVAELAENATVFSPPNTPVRIAGDIVGRGFAVEVEDRGLGITDERLAEINRNLASPPAFDLSGSDRLGLFIAGRLARRHDIKITLRPSPYGGTTAIVIIPLSLVVEEGAYETIPAVGADGRALSVSGRHALSDGSDGRGLGGPGPREALTGPDAGTGGRGDGPGGRGDGPGGRDGRDGGSWPAGPGSPGTRPAAGAPAAPVTVSSIPLSPLPGSPLPASPEVVSQEGAPPVSASPVPAPPAGRAAAASTPATPGPGGPAPVAGLDTGRRGNGSPDPGRPASGPARAAASPSGLGALSDLDGLSGLDGLGDVGDLSDTGELGNFGLPVRVRQASLAPQLRDAGAADGQPARAPRQASPEAARNTMAALQRGWALGRLGGGSQPGDAGNGPGADSGATAVSEAVPDSAPPAAPGAPGEASGADGADQ
ncbi:MAG TPA: nitrate- and nitrite sensing domain-containing protein [Streptosporangiaceae bacterium]|nr:nitrate- and nitrite sensing domain-containing protein [Streptosporangiaceae bacterium]